MNSEPSWKEARASPPAFAAAPAAAAAAGAPRLTGHGAPAHEANILAKATPEAEAICPDRSDIPFFALAMKMRIPIWSNDKKLKEQSEVVVYSTAELLGQF